MGAPATVLFVHGTGVRQGSYLTTFAAVQQAFERHGIDHALEPCLWGDTLGASAIVRSLPDIALSPSDPQPLTRDENYARWELLYRDPRFELRLLKNRPSAGPRPPDAGARTAALWARIREYRPSDAVQTFLRERSLDTAFGEAWIAVVVDERTAQQATTAATEVGEPAQAVARAVVAEMLGRAFAADLPIPDADQRDALVDRLVADWEANVAGVGAFLLGFMADMAATAATPILKWQRGQAAAGANPAAGDILRYQARGSPIRDYIRTSVERIDGDVYLLAHSLGGIACVDLLALQALPTVRGLITVGSQAPYLHEIGALIGLEPGTAALPDHFPPWLNLYDPYDFLSYVAAPIFRGGVRDCRIESGQPFPHSHSAYWTHPDTWAAIRGFLP